MLSYQAYKALVWRIHCFFMESLRFFIRRSFGFSEASSCLAMMSLSDLKLLFLLALLFGKYIYYVCFVYIIYNFASTVYFSKWKLFSNFTRNSMFYSQIAWQVASLVFGCFCYDVLPCVQSDAVSCFCRCLKYG